MSTTKPHYKHGIVPPRTTFTVALLFLSPPGCSLVPNFHLSPRHSLKVNFFWCILKLILLLWRPARLRTNKTVSTERQKLSVVTFRRPNGENCKLFKNNSLVSFTAPVAFVLMTFQFLWNSICYLVLCTSMFEVVAVFQPNE